MRIITAIRDSLGNARVVYICAARCACARYSSRAKTAKKIPVFCTFWRNPFADFDDSLEPSSGFSLPILCISRRLNKNWGSLLQTLPHTHTITQIIVRFHIYITQPVSREFIFNTHISPITREEGWFCSHLYSIFSPPLIGKIISTLYLYKAS